MSVKRIATMLAKYSIVALVAVACVTVNIYFPAAKVEKAAERIVDDIYGQPAGEQGEQPKGEEQSSIKTLLALLPEWGASEAWAEDAASVSNAAIRGLKDQIRSGLGALGPYLAAGNVGIGKDGMLAVRSVSGVPLPKVAQIKNLVQANNNARGQLFAEVAAAMKLQPSQVGQVQAVFAKVFRDKAPAGWQVQDDSGAWREK